MKLYPEKRLNNLIIKELDMIFNEVIYNLHLDLSAFFLRFHPSCIFLSNHQIRTLAQFQIHFSKTAADLLKKNAVELKREMNYLDTLYGKIK